jgi:hypothetical protein
VFSGSETAKKYAITSVGENTMKTNESNLDRIIRVVLGIVLLVLYFTNVVSGTMGIIFIILGAIALLTGIVGFCPLYALLKIRTNRS